MPAASGKPIRNAANVVLGRRIGLVVVLLDFMGTILGPETDALVSIDQRGGGIVTIPGIGGRQGMTAGGELTRFPSRDELPLAALTCRKAVSGNIFLLGTERRFALF